MRKGETRKPCPGCGQAGLRNVNEVCFDCQQKLREADAAREQRESDKDHRAYRLPRLFPHYIIPAGYHSRGEQVRSLEAAITQWMDKLAHSAGTPVAGKHFPSERLFSYPKGHRVEYGYPSCCLMFRPETAEAFDQLDTAIQAALEGAYQAGKEDGSHLLLSLADGTITVADFNKRIAP